MATETRSWLQMQIPAGGALWAHERSVAASSPNCVRTRNESLPGSGFEVGAKAEFGLYQNESDHPADFWITSDADDHIFAVAGNPQNLVARASAFLAAELSVAIAGCEPAFNAFQAEPAKWLHFSAHGHVILASRGPIHQLRVDGEYFVNADHLVAYSRTLAIQSPEAFAKMGKLLLRNRIYHFTGYGMVWSQHPSPTTAHTNNFDK